MSRRNADEMPSIRRRNAGTRGSLTLTASATVGLFFIQRYRFLTIDQYARIAGMNRNTASHQLCNFERHGLLGHFGNTGLAAGYGKTPKVYFLTRKGYALLSRESDIPPELLGPHKAIKVESRWSPQMYHRLRTVDLMISAEEAVGRRPQLAMVQTFLEYRLVKRGPQISRETTDFVSVQETAENRIIPDAALIVENRETGRKGLFFIECDQATERITTHLRYHRKQTLHFKFEQYDRYLTGGRFANTYSAYGEFGFFTLLFVTLGLQRVENIRAELHDLPDDLAHYYRLTTFEQAMGDFFGPIWKSRSHLDTRLYPLVSERGRP